jgi:hypothetical protein
MTTCRLPAGGRHRARERGGRDRPVGNEIYPDSAHGFLFQHHAEFAADVETFLSDPG